MGVVIAAQCNGFEGHCSTVSGVRAMTSSAAAWERPETKADKPVGNNRVRLTPTGGQLTAHWGGGGGEDEQLGDFFWPRPLRGIPIVRNTGNMCASVSSRRDRLIIATPWFKSASVSGRKSFVLTSITSYTAADVNARMQCLKLRPWVFVTLTRLWNRTR